MELVTLGVEVKTTGSQQGSQELGKFSTAAKGAAASADALEDQIRALGAAQAQTANASRPLSGALQGVGQAFSRNSSAIQNASFQLQDIIVQISGGVDASRALGMQLPQLLGGFGALGAVAGLAVGALLSFAPALFETTDASEELKDAVDALNDAMDAYASASAAAAAPTSKLIEQYGAASEKARELLLVNRELAQLDALDKLAEASLQVVSAFGDFGGQTGAELTATAEKAAQLRAEMEQLNAQIDVADPMSVGMLANRQAGLQMQIDALSGYREGVERVRVALGSTEEQAVVFSAALADLQNAMTLDDKIAAFERVKTLFVEITGGTKNMTAEQRLLAQELIRAALASLDLSDNTSAAAGNISAAASNATGLANELQRAASNAITLAQQSFSTRAQAELRLQYAGDPVGLARAQAEQTFDEQAGAMINAPVGGDFFARQREIYVENEVAAAEAQLALQEFNKTLSGKGGTGGASSTTDAAAEAKRLYESTRTEAERYAVELEKVQGLYAIGAIDADLYGRAIEDLNAKFDPFTKLMMGVAGTIESELNNAFASVLKGTATLSEALLDFAANVLAKVAQDLFAQQFAGPIAQGVSGFLGGLFSAKGNVFNSSGVTPFAQGGVVSGPTVFPFANGVGLMGEAGPEAIMPLSRGADGRLGVVANSNNAPTVTINNYSGQPATASTDSAGNITVEIGRAVAQDITSGGPAYRAIRSTFGLANRLQQRG